jgi:hypothetical protein
MGSDDASKPFIEQFDYEKLDLEDTVEDIVREPSKFMLDLWKIFN